VVDGLKGPPGGVYGGLLPLHPGQGVLLAFLPFSPGFSSAMLAGLMAGLFVITPSKQRWHEIGK